ncbi:PadR family transcriptional regulator [Microbacterium invictum]|uniref:DNA-binding PadR family transcriptional regulator n=1 Tax=Microbacterium invictum TaxID=515415 RepID=A0AA40SQF3_9MICO|nr:MULTISPECIES: PadR family transcriptional regulator [Microbacterium]MBB4140503.1 DNA-binding PadR family transcriptional regulator [Microbacterium invictum]
MAESLTPLSVIVVGLLRERDMHPYEMMRLIRQRGDDRLVTIANGTFYHTVTRLERRGYAASVGIDRAGNRPARTTYRLTERGAEAGAQWVRQELPRLGRLTEFRVALSESHDLPRGEVIDLLTQRRAALAEYTAELRDRLAAAAAREVPVQFLVEIERESAILDADFAWLDGFLSRLADPTVAWGIDELPVETRERLDAFRESVIS